MVISSGDRCASFDGDADRIVFYYTEQGTYGLSRPDVMEILLSGF